MKSFRSLFVYSERVIDLKVDYMHQNPVRRGICEFPLEYRWSSANTWEHGPY